ncbi:MFS transporter [Variovorax sp. 2RAF20]
MSIYLTTHLKYDKTTVYWIMMAAVGVTVAILMPFWCGLSDRWGRRRVLGIGFLGYMLLV